MCCCVMPLVLDLTLPVLITCLALLWCIPFCWEFQSLDSFVSDSNFHVLSLGIPILIFSLWYSSLDILSFGFQFFIFSSWDSNLNVVSLGFQSSYSPSVIASVFHLGTICAWLHTVNVCVYIYVQLTVVLCCLHVCHALRCLHVCDVER